MLNKTKHPQRNHGSLPSLNTTLPTRTESYTPTEPDSALFFEKSKTNFTQASQVILFSADTLRRAVQRCIQQTQNENLQSSFAPTLQKLKSTSERLGQQLESSLAIHSSLVQTIACLKELCFQIGTRLSILVQGLDPKTSRHLLTSLYSATVDTKEAWELICPCLTIDPVYTLHRNNNRSNPVLKSPLTGDNSQLYTFMKNAVAGSFHVLSTLRRSIQESLVSLTLPSLESKLKELLRQAEHVTALSHRLEKSIESQKDLERQESSRIFWEDTSVYLKAMVSLMTLIRTISKEEDFVWPRTVKQGCLYVTRMTAEVAKHWNKSSTFAQDGFFLGKS